VQGRERRTICARRPAADRIPAGLSSRRQGTTMLKRALYTSVAWVDARLRLSALFASTAGHKVPRSTGSWFYVFGSGTLRCCVIQVGTGICLALVYAPTASDAWTSLEYLNHQQYLGWYLRGVHFWGSNFMVAIMALHLAQTFLFGAFKYPREMTWISGCVLL